MVNIFGGFERKFSHGRKTIVDYWRQNSRESSQRSAHSSLRRSTVSHIRPNLSQASEHSRRSVISFDGGENILKQIPLSSRRESIATSYSSLNSPRHSYSHGVRAMPNPLLAHLKQPNKRNVSFFMGDRQPVMVPGRPKLSEARNTFRKQLRQEVIICNNCIMFNNVSFVKNMIGDSSDVSEEEVIIYEPIPPENSDSDADLPSAPRLTWEGSLILQEVCAKKKNS